MQVRVNRTWFCHRVHCPQHSGSGTPLFLIYWSVCTAGTLALIERVHTGTTRSQDIAACMCLQQNQWALQSLPMPNHLLFVESFLLVGLSSWFLDEREMWDEWGVFSNCIIDFLAKVIWSRCESREEATTRRRPGLSRTAAQELVDESPLWRKLYFGDWTKQRRY